MADIPMVRVTVPRELLKEFAAVLNPGGPAVCTTQAVREAMLLMMHAGVSARNQYARVYRDWLGQRYWPAKSDRRPSDGRPRLRLAV